MNAAEWLNKMMDAINYMEGHMDEQINIEDVAKVACSSTFHFQRMFHMLTGFTVAEYIRSRRLTLAAQELAISSNIRVIDIVEVSSENFLKNSGNSTPLQPNSSNPPKRIFENIKENSKYTGFLKSVIPYPMELWLIIYGIEKSIKEG